MIPQPPKQEVDPKAKQFNEELNELCDRYQYTLQPSLNVRPDGILPTLTIVNRVPPKQTPKRKDIKKTPKKK